MRNILIASSLFALCACGTEPLSSAPEQEPVQDEPSDTQPWLRENQHVAAVDANPSVPRAAIRPVVSSRRVVGAGLSLALEVMPSLPGRWELRSELPNTGIVENNTFISLRIGEHVVEYIRDVDGVRATATIHVVQRLTDAIDVAFGADATYFLRTQSITRFHPGTSSVVSIAEFDERLTAMEIDSTRGVAYVASAAPEPKLHRVDLQTGAHTEMFALPNYSSFTPYKLRLVGDELFIFAPAASMVLDVETNTTRDLSPGGHLSSLFIRDYTLGAGDVIYISALDFDREQTLIIEWNQNTDEARELLAIDSLDVVGLSSNAAGELFVLQAQSLSRLGANGLEHVAELGFLASALRFTDADHYLAVGFAGLVEGDLTGEVRALTPLFDEAL